VQAGWNLVGSITYPVAASNVCSSPPHIIISPFWGYSLGYDPADTLKPGGGYWVKVSQNGTIRLDRYVTGCDEEGPDFASMDKFTITDADGNEQDLYVANSERDSSAAASDGDMPPPPPDAVFDARFEQGEGFKAVNPESGTVDLNILVQTENPPITLSWVINPENGITYSFPDSGGFGKRAAIIGKGSLTLSGGGVIRLNGRASSTKVQAALPTEYKLEQNYPNPFNPTTKIKYGLPLDSYVSIKVFDVLGRVVATLADQNQKAGW
jgi:hypothetical protein